MSASTRFSALKSLKKVATVLMAVAALSISTGALAPAPASAATGITGCFNFRGVAYVNVATLIEYWSTSSTWEAVPGSISHTNSTGCYSYTLSGSYTQLNMHVVAAAWVPALRGFLWNSGGLYATPGVGTVSLGNARLSYLSAASLPAPPKNKKLTDSWVNEMTAGGRRCDSAALAVTCFMDENGMVGNVIVLPLDTDEDGILDREDHHIFDHSRP